MRDPDTTTCDDPNIEVISVHDVPVPTIDDDVVRNAGDAVTAS